MVLCRGWSGLEHAAAGLIVLAVGWGVILVRHALNIDRLTRWAESSLDTHVPEGTGPWQAAFAALYRRTRARRAHERDLAHTIERFQSAAEAIPDGMVVLDASHRIKWANARAQRMLGLDLGHDVGAPLMNLVRQPRVRPLPRGGRLLAGGRARFAARSRQHARDADRAVRRRGEAADLRATSPRSRRSRACAATSSPTCRTSSRRRSR